MSVVRRDFRVSAKQEGRHPRITSVRASKGSLRQIYGGRADSPSLKAGLRVWEVSPATPAARHTPRGIAHNLSSPVRNPGDAGRAERGWRPPK